MHTLLLRNLYRSSSKGKTFTIEVLGDNHVKDALKESIRELEYHPAPAARRSLIDMLGLIEKHRLEIRYAERDETEEGDELWMFVLQG